MKGILLAGGTGSRLYPLTKIINKHLLPVYNKPMIYYPLQTLIDSGIDDILIVSGREHVGNFIDLLGSGKEFGVHFSYEIQEEAGGIAQALGLCERWSNGDSVVVILGDNIFEDTITGAIHEFKDGAKIFLKHIPFPNRFGVPVFSNDETIHYIEEKPLYPKTQFAVTGMYIYDSKVFSYIKNLKPSSRGELEITDVNNRYAEQHVITYCILKGYWSDAGTFDSLLNAGLLVKG